MKLAEAAGKSGVLVLAGAFIVWFLSDLLSVPASGNLFEKVILTTTVVLAIRISLLLLLLAWRNLLYRHLGGELEFAKSEVKGLNLAK